MGKYIFLDRDGVINSDGAFFEGKKYITEWEYFVFNPGVLDALKLAKEKGYKIIVISNQQCVGKNICSQDDLDELTLRMKNAVSEAGGEIGSVFYCVHREEDNCSCRKPKTGLFEKAFSAFNITDPGRFYFVGDTERDIIAGNKAGLKTALVYSGKTKKWEESAWDIKPDRAFDDLLECVKYIINEDFN